MNVRVKWGISAKLNMVIGLVFLLAIGGISAWNQSDKYDSSLQSAQQTALLELFDESEVFRDQLSQTETVLRSLQYAMEDMKNNGAADREAAIRLLQKQLSSSRVLFALYTVWEPDAFDAKDAANRNKTAHDDASGRFIPYVVRSGDKIVVEPNKDYTVEGAGDYYLLPKKSGTPQLIEPYIYEANGEKVAMTSLVLPIMDKQGSFIGIVGADLLLAGLDKQIKEVNPYGGYGTLVSAGGTYVVNGNDSKLAMKPYADTGEKKELLTQINAGKTLIYSKDDAGKTDVMRIVTTIEVEGVAQKWHMEAVMPMKNILSDYNKQLWTSVISVAVIIAVLFTLVYFILRWLVIGNVNKVIALAGRMAAGDFTDTLRVRSKDEFGAMAEHFNDMIGKLRGMVMSVRDASLAVAASSQQLSASAEQTSQAAETISEAIQDVAAGADSQVHSSSETARAMTEMSLGVQRIAESASQVAMSAQEVSERTRLGNEKMRETVDQMERIQHNVSEAASNVRSLGERSQEIGAISELIQSISYRTNLLALNAGIEAARAGEHGKGFAVVAGEIKKLAEQVRESTEQISAIIELIQKETKHTIETMEEGSAEVEKGTAAAMESGELFARILKEMQGVNDQIQDVSAASEQISASSEEVTATVDQLAVIASQALDRTNHVAAASEEQVATMQEVNSSAQMLKGIVTDLQNLVERWKV